MNLGTLYWLAGVCQGFKILLTVASVLGFATCIGFLIYHFTDGSHYYKYIHEVTEDEWRSSRKRKIFRTKLSIVICVIGIILSILTPDRKEVLAMYVIPRIENNQLVKDVSKKAFDRIMRILDEDINGGCNGVKCSIGDNQ